MSDVEQFLSRCERSPAALVPVKSAWKAFNDGLPAGRRGMWSRDRFLGELIRAGLSIGELEGRCHVCGLALPGVGWQVTDGRVAMEVA